MILKHLGKFGYSTFSLNMLQSEEIFCKNRHEKEKPMSSIIANYSLDSVIIASDSKSIRVSPSGEKYSSYDQKKILCMDGVIIGITGRTNYLWEGKEEEILKILEEEITENTPVEKVKHILSVMEKVTEQLEIYNEKEEVVNAVIFSLYKKHIACVLYTGKVKKDLDGKNIHEKFTHCPSPPDKIISGVLHCLNDNSFKKNFIENSDPDNKEWIIKGIKINEENDETVGGKIQMYKMLSSGEIYNLSE